jgi:radical SAM protein with 4Fe4S-binding SPASM domain
LDIETTNICNLKCPMCPRTILVENAQFSNLERMSREHYAGIIDQAAAVGVKSVKLNYLGEPLAHKDVVWQVEYAKRRGIIDVMMNTNAVLLNRKMGKSLLEAGIDSMFISFDAVSPDLFAEQRVGTTIGKVIDNVYEFVKLRDKGFPHVQVRLSMVMYDDPKWRRQFEGIKIMWEHLVDAVGYGDFGERDLEKQTEYPEVEGFHCAQPFQRMMLKVNGNATICCADERDEVVVGNWREEDIGSIWNGKKFREIRELHRSGGYYQIDLCRNCIAPLGRPAPET